MKIAILTNMMDFNPGYSLTGIIKDQTIMLTRYGHEVHLYVNQQFNMLGADEFSHVKLHRSIPFAHLIDYKSCKEITEDHAKTIEETQSLLERELVDFDFVYTHDFVFTGWFLPYGMGTVRASKRLPNVQFLHWIHSIPSILRDWWNIRAYGPNHKLIFPNETERLQVAEQYRGAIDNVRVIPHIKDLRTFAEFSDETMKIIDIVPQIMSSTIFQVLPAGTDRLHAKGVEQVIRIFGGLKRCGAKVCLLIANQWATGRQRKQCIDPYINIAKEQGLKLGEEFAFISDLHPDWHNGIGKTMLRELFMCSNLFVFPTSEESFGLVVPEAAIAGACLPVLNKSLDQQREISGNQALYFDFGSFNRAFSITEHDRYYEDIAAIIIGRIQQNEAIKTKTWFKNFNNYDYLYNQYYNPIMKELKGVSEYENSGNNTGC